MEWCAASVGLILAFGAWCILRVRAEYLQQARLSSPTVVAVWVLYLAHLGITLAAAATSRWPLPVNLAGARVAGTLLLGAGALLFLGGIVSFGSFRRMSGLNTSRLVTTGAYRWSRNPQNVGWALFLAGIALVGRSGFALLMTAVFWATFRVYLSAEEEFLERTFGEAYRDYRASTHRYLGPPGSRSLGRRGQRNEPRR
jgi:protein-S-isoprenylcysteine O-methyltransferase Ste14